MKGAQIERTSLKKKKVSALDVSPQKMEISEKLL